MLKTDELHNPDSCLNKAALNEPLFVLRAQDVLAPRVVEFWANLLYGESLRNQIEGRLPQDPPSQKVVNARKIADLMRRWNGPKKLPD